MHIFLSQLVMKKISTPCFKVYAMMIEIMQNASKLSSLKKQLTHSFTTINTNSENAVIKIRERDVPQGYYFTFEYSIFITDSQLFCFCLSFLGLGWLLSSGGRNMTAPLGKKRKLGYLECRYCTTKTMTMSRSASMIMVLIFKRIII